MSHIGEIVHNILELWVLINLRASLRTRQNLIMFSQYPCFEFWWRIVIIIIIIILLLLYYRGNT